MTPGAGRRRPAWAPSCSAASPLPSMGCWAGSRTCAGSEGGPPGASRPLVAPAARRPSAPQFSPVLQPPLHLALEAALAGAVELRPRLAGHPLGEELPAAEPLGRVVVVDVALAVAQALHEARGGVEDGQ